MRENRHVIPQTQPTEPGYYCVMILSSVHMPQGGSPQRSKGLKRQGSALIERVENTPFRQPKNAKITQKCGFEPKFSPLGPKFSHARMPRSALPPPCGAFRKFHTRCVPSQLILRMKNSGSEESLAVDAARFRVRHFPPGGAAWRTYGSPRFAPPLFSSAPDLSSLSVQGQCWCPRVAACAPHAHTKQAAEHMGALAALVSLKCPGEASISSLREPKSPSTPRGRLRGSLTPPTL